MKITQTMPESGQFVAVWEYNGCAWSSTHKWECGSLVKYNEFPDGEPDMWSEVPNDSSFYEEVGAEFIAFGDCK